MKNQTSSIGEKTDTLLFEHFATLATAPDGIAQLRELILQLAVQGKLGTQDAGDEPAIKKLNLMMSEKKSLVKQGIIRKTKDLLPILSEDVQFLIPSNWVWTIIDNIGKNEPNSIVDGPFGSNLLLSDYVDNGEYPVISISNIDNGFERDSIRYISKEKFESLKRSAVKPGDIIMAKIGSSYGKCGYYPDHLSEGIIPANLLKVTVSEKLSKPFIYLFFKSLFLKQELDLITNITAQPAFGVTNFKRLFIPLPPLAEQHRIVAKVDRLMVLCDELEARQQQERAGCLKLGTASLEGLQNAESSEEFGRQWAQVCDAFELILDCPENVAMLRQTVLQLAVQGRLVRQESGDEPAGNLVERLVKEGKIKREKPLEFIREEEKAYSIPNLWTWIRLGESIESMANGIYKPGVFYSDDGIACLRMYNINSGKINFKNLKRMVLNDQERRQYLLKQGDLLVNRVNSRELVGKAAVIPDIKEPVIFESKNIRVRFNTDIILPGFVNILFQTKEVWQVWQGNAKQTCGQASVSQPQIAGICTPLPPLAEQHRIVAKVDALMALCDAFDLRLKERAGVQGRLAGAVVKQVAGVS